MELSQEQKDRIKQNRERALEIQRQRKLLLETSALAEDNNDNNSRTPTKHSLDTSNDTSNESNMKRSKGDPSNARTPNGTERGASVTEGGGVVLFQSTLSLVYNHKLFLSYLFITVYN